MNTNNIDKMTKRLKRICEKQFKQITIIVNNIITYKVKDKNIIEHTLDSLLDLTYMVDTKTVYYKLLNYWKHINPESANDYENFYLEIIAEDENYTLKRQK